MVARDTVWALQQYEAIRSLLPTARMPKSLFMLGILGQKLLTYLTCFCLMPLVF